jgi:hypothetical protein
MRIFKQYAQKMKGLIFVILLFCLAAVACAQTDTLSLEKKGKDRYGIWVIPSSSKNIYGIAIGPFGSETFCKIPYTKYSHGLNLQLPGQGFLQTFYFPKGVFQDVDAMESDDSLTAQNTLPLRAIHNGLLISPLGTFTNQVNGISLSLWMSMGQKVNGVSINVLWNLYKEINGVSIGFVNQTAVTRGLQIGVVNRTNKLKGIQLGLWNKNEKRALPFINWNFSDKKQPSLAATPTKQLVP